MCCSMLFFGEVCEENLTSCRYEIGKWKSIWTVFSDKWRHSFVLLHPNLTSGSSLKVSCCVEAESILNILYSLTLKSIDPPCILNGYFVYAWFWPHEPWKGLGSPKGSSAHTLRTAGMNGWSIFYFMEQPSLCKYTSPRETQIDKDYYLQSHLLH